MLIKQYSLFDSETGEIVKKIESKQQSYLGKDWVAMYVDQIAKLNKECPNFATMKVFIHLCSLMRINKSIVSTKTAIARELGMTYKTVIDAFNWLKANNYVQETRNNGYSAFEINPDIAVCGKDRDLKRKQWITRSGAIANSIYSNDDK